MPRKWLHPGKRHGICGRPTAVFRPFKTFDEALDGFASAHLEVVDAERVLVHAQLYSTNIIKLINMDFALDSKFICRIEKRARFIHPEIALFAKGIHVIDEAFGRESGQHVRDDMMGVGRRVFEFRRNGVAAEERGLDGDGRGFLESGDDAEHFALGIERQAVPGFDLHGTHTLRNGAVYAFQGVVEKRVLAHGLQGLGGIEDAAAAFGNLLVGRPFEPHEELLAAAARKDRVGVAVAPRRKHPTPLGVDDVQAGPIDDAGEVVHRTKVRDQAILQASQALWRMGNLAISGQPHRRGTSSNAPTRPLMFFSSVRMTCKVYLRRAWQETPLATFFV